MRAILVTEKGGTRILDIGWRPEKQTREHYRQKDMPGLWMEVCYSNRKEFDEAFAKIKEGRLLCRRDSQRAYG